MPIGRSDNIRKLNSKNESSPGLRKWLQVQSKFSEFYLLSQTKSEDVFPRIDGSSRQLLIERVYEKGVWHYLAHEYNSREDSVNTYNAGRISEQDGFNRHELSELFSENRNSSLNLPEKIAVRMGLGSQRPAILKKMDKLIEEYNSSPELHKDKLEQIIRTAADAVSDSLNNMIFGRVNKDRREELFQLIDHAMERQQKLGINLKDSDISLYDDAMAAAMKLSIRPEKQRELVDILKLIHVMSKLEPVPSNLKLVRSQLDKMLKTIPDSEKQAIIKFSEAQSKQSTVARQDITSVQSGKAKIDKKDEQETNITMHGP